MTLAARNVQFVEGGLAGEIGGSRMVLGTAALMVKLGAAYPFGPDGG